MEYTTLLKITPQLNRRRGREGIARQSCERVGEVGKERNLYPGALGRVLFQKSYADSKGLRTREILSLMAPFQGTTQ